jgi:Cu-processing system permease protein
MWQFVLSSWRSGFRGKTFLGVFILGVALVGVAYLSASFSPRQPRTVALDVGLSGLRFSLVLFAIVLVQELVGREIDRRSVVLTLSYPVPRSSYLIGRYLGVLLLTAVAAIILALLLWIAVLLAGVHYEQQFRVELGWPYWIAVGGVWLDVAVVTAFSFWIASLSTVAMLPFALGALFAIAGKALGPMADYLAQGAGGQDDLVASYGPLLDAIRWLLPDLSRLDWRVWPMYGSAPDELTIGLALLMALAYVGVMIGLAIHFFARREFS